MNQRDKISVIVPIYKVEIYLEKCVNSILNQTYKNLEVILVDDGSPDNCGNLCDQLAQMDERISVVHKENGGLSSARNAGLDVATGSYIGFVDSDDCIEPSMYEELISFLKENNCDLTECGVNMLCGETTKLFSPEKSEVITGVDALRLQLSSTGNEYMPRIAVWSKLFKREFWENHRFPDGQIHEDYMITCEALYSADRVGLVKKGLYNHLLTNSNSIMNSKFGAKDLFLEKQYLDRIEFLRKKNNQELLNLAEKQYYLLLLSLYWRCALNNMSEQEHYLKVLQEKKTEIFSCDMPTKRMMEYKMLFFSPRLYMFIRKNVIRLRLK